MPKSSSWVCGQMHFVQTFVFLHLNGREHSQFSSSSHQKSTFGVGLIQEGQTWGGTACCQRRSSCFHFQWNVLAPWAYTKTFLAVPRHYKWKIPHLCFPVESPDAYIVERLFSSSLVVVVSLSMPRRMNVYHFKKGTEICNYSYSNNILSVRLNRQVRTGDLSRREGVAPALGCRACVYLLFLLCLCQSDWWCVWRSLFISTISKIWSYSRPCSTHQPTSQVQWEGRLCLNWVNYYHFLGYCSSLIHSVITCCPAVIVGGLTDEKQNAASLALSAVLQAFVRSLSTTAIPTWHTLAVPP